MTSPHTHKMKRLYLKLKHRAKHTIVFCPRCWVPVCLSNLRIHVSTIHGSDTANEFCLHCGEDESDVKDIWSHRYQCLSAQLPDSISEAHVFEL